MSLTMRSCFVVILLLANHLVAAADRTLDVEAPNSAAFRRSVAQIADLRAAGNDDPVTLRLPAGEYRFAQQIQLTPEIVGNGLSLVAEQPGSVIFSAAVPLKPTRENAPGQWRYSLPTGWNRDVAPRAVIIDGTLLSSARFPNEGYLRIERALPDRRSGFIVQESDLPPEFDLNAGLCDLVLLHDWSSSRIPVAALDQATRELRTIGPIGCAADHYAIDHFERQPRYWLEGHPSFADQPGEWFFDRERKEIVVIGGDETETPPEVELPTVSTMLVAGDIDAAPLSRFALRGITFRGTDFPMPPGGLAAAQATMHEPRGADGQRTNTGRPMLPAAVMIENAVGCEIRNCQFTNLGSTGLWLAGRVRDSTIVGCTFDLIGGNGLNMGEDNGRRVDGKTWYQAAPDQVPSGNRIEGCEISRCGTILPGAVAIWAPLNRRLEIVDNHIHDCPYTGISLGWIWSQAASPAGRNRIADNRIEFVMQVLSDGGGIYTLGRQPESVIENNQISDVPLNAGRAESNGMFLDEGTTGFTIQSNTIRRIDRSPLRFHKAGKNLARANRWELATAATPPVRYNNTPPENITLVDNQTIPKQERIFLIGNSLTWDTRPPNLDGDVHWHVDCGKSLPFIRNHPQDPCVDSSRLWPRAFATAQYDFVSVQPHYGSTLDEDFATISHWLTLQPEATFVIHTGWPRHASLSEERADEDPAGSLTHSAAYFDTLLRRLRESYPDREFRTTNCQALLHRIADDIESGTAPIESIDQLYRDAIHMTHGGGRYLMHNAMRRALGQPRSSGGFDDLDPALKRYLDGVLGSLDES